MLTAVMTFVRDLENQIVQQQGVVHTTKHDAELHLSCVATRRKITLANRKEKGKVITYVITL
jgi:hypothetical protein